MKYEFNKGTLAIVPNEENSCLVYEDEEFASFEDNYTRDNRTGYIAIVNSFVKETIKGGSGIKIKRHKGTKAIDR